LLELRHYGAALADFDRALARGRDDVFLHTGRGVALEGLGRHAEADESFRLAFDRGRPTPEAALTRCRWVYAFAVAARLPAKAQAVFDEVLRREPENPQALYGRAMLAAEEGELGRAVGFFDRALRSNPGFVDARRNRAVLLARQGRFEPATRDINWCLEREPQGGATLYAAACVLARAAERTLDPEVANQALDFLERAFLQGYGKDRAAGDKDLAGIRRLDGFRQLLATNTP
jgi:tetratricopeptide (TPR) repeat protein